MAVARKQKLTSKQVAMDITVSTERVRNWYYRGTGMTALDLLLLMSEYTCINDCVEGLVAERKAAKGW